MTDKYIFEIESDVGAGYLYKIKGINNQYFTEEFFNKFQPYNDRYNEGYQDGFKAQILLENMINNSK